MAEKIVVSSNCVELAFTPDGLVRRDVVDQLTETGFGYIIASIMHGHFKMRINEELVFDEEHWILDTIFCIGYYAVSSFLNNKQKEFSLYDLSFKQGLKISDGLISFPDTFSDKLSCKAQCEIGEFVNAYKIFHQKILSATIKSYPELLTHSEFCSKFYI